MKDFLGQELSVGDDIVILVHSRTSSELKLSKVAGFTNVFVKIYGGKIVPYKVIKINKVEVKDEH